MSDKQEAARLAGWRRYIKWDGAKAGNYNDHPGVAYNCGWDDGAAFLAAENAKLRLDYEQRVRELQAMSQLATMYEGRFMRAEAREAKLRAAVREAIKALRAERWLHAELALTEALRIAEEP